MMEMGEIQDDPMGKSMEKYIEMENYTNGDRSASDGAHVAAVCFSARQR